MPKKFDEKTNGRRDILYKLRNAQIIKQTYAVDVEPLDCSDEDAILTFLNKNSRNSKTTLAKGAYCVLFWG